MASAASQFGGQPFQPTVAKIQRLGHFVLKVRAFDEACRFHTEVLGFRVSDRVDGMICFMRCHPNPYHHGVGLGRADEELLHHVNFMVSEVDDVGRAIARFGKSGTRIVYGPGRHPPGDRLMIREEVVAVVDAVKADTTADKRLSQRAVEQPHVADAVADDRVDEGERRRRKLLDSWDAAEGV